MQEYYYLRGRLIIGEMNKPGTDGFD